MSENMSRDWQKLATKMVCSYTEKQTEQIKDSVITRHRTNVHRRRAIALAGVFLIIGGVGFLLNQLLFENLFQGSSDGRPLAVDSPIEKPSDKLSAENGSNASPRAIPLSPGTRFSVEEELHVSTYTMEKGSLRFEVDPGVTQKLLVRVGSLTIEDIGTVFTVKTLPEDQVQVAVTEGKVIVTWSSGHTELNEGAEGIFPSTPEGMLLAVESASGELGADESGNVVSLKTTAGNGQRTGADWRMAARQGQNQLALTLIEQKPARVRNKVDDLLLAADVMRLTGHSKRAVPYLNKIVRQFPRDARRAPAAFTLGKVLLDKMGKASAAAKAFSIASRNRSPIAEEAMAREAEAWYRAGQSDKASEAARQYLKKFPNGARAHSIKEFMQNTP